MLDSDLWTETLFPSYYLLPHTCAVRRKEATILAASPTLATLAADLPGSSYIVRRVHMAAGHPLGRVPAHENGACDISESSRVLGSSGWWREKKVQRYTTRKEAFVHTVGLMISSRRPYASSSRFEPATMSCRYPFDLSCSTMTSPFEPV